MSELRRLFEDAPGPVHGREVSIQELSPICETATSLLRAIDVFNAIVFANTTSDDDRLATWMRVKAQSGLLRNQLSALGLEWVSNEDRNDSGTFPSYPFDREPLALAVTGMADPNARDNSVTRLVAVCETLEHGRLVVRQG